MIRGASVLGLFLAFLAACDSSSQNGDAAGGALRCGAGTRLLDGACVPDTSPVTCGPGTTLDGAQCRPTQAAGGQGGSAGSSTTAGAAGDSPAGQAGSEPGGSAGSEPGGGAGSEPGGAAGDNQGGKAGYTGKDNWGGFPGAGGGVGDGGTGGNPGPGGSGPGGSPGCDGGTCDHSVCESGPKLIFECSSCVATVCAADDFCCNNEWDGQCIGEAVQFCGCDCGGGPGGPGGAGGSGPTLEPACDLPATPPSGGSCVTLGGDIACNPVSGASCTQAGFACDYSDKGYACYGPPNDKKLCEACDYNNQQFCENGTTCIDGICLRYCCEDADCGLNGVCSKDGNAVGICYKSSGGEAGSAGSGGEAGSAGEAGNAGETGAGAGGENSSAGGGGAAGKAGGGGASGQTAGAAGG
jgi:hypothetical protein